ncbi:diguanylate cyclase domain-containing protein [Alkalihalobacillus sp. 1P02AB]|uniref:sensor domain-containing diguanylate cyclase n=1 Tax=Alkalihalobacillus sp. 1P02AB TaxID=3132260 RepID=UPI0039A658A5
MNVAIQVNEQATSEEYQFFMKILNQVHTHSQSLTESIAFLLINQADTKLAYFNGLVSDEEEYIHRKCRQLIQQKQFYAKDENYEYYGEEALLAKEGSYFFVVSPYAESSLKNKQEMMTMLKVKTNLHDKSDEFLKLCTTNILKKTNFQINWTTLSQALAELVNDTYKEELCVTVLENVNDELMIVVSSNEVLQNVVNWNKELILNQRKDVFNLSNVHGGTYQHFTVIPIEKEETLIGYILFGYSDSSEQSFLQDSLSLYLDDLKALFIQGYELEKAQYQSRNQDLLLQVTKKLHSSMNIGDVLSEIIDVIQEVFDGFKVKVMLSHEWNGDESMKIYLLDYRDNGDNPTVEKVYLTGEIEISEEEQIRTLYAPLHGRQGVYGVLEIAAPQNRLFTKNELSFIELLADIGGNALENAELYQQSQKLIHDLQLINQTSKEINSNLKLVDTVEFIRKQILESFYAEEVGILLLNQEEKFTLIKGSTEYFQQNGIQTEIENLLERVKFEMDSIYIGKAENEQALQHFPYQSVLAIPMMRKKKLEGIFLVMHHQPFHFNFDDFKLLQAIIQHCTLAFSNSIIHEELERLVITDHLTELYSRSYLDGQVQKSFQTGRRGCFLLLDIDNFKKINDTFGHQVGDEILVQVGKVLKENTRDRDIVARWGGEELAVYLPKVTKETGYFIAQRIVKAIADATRPKVTASCGLSYWEIETTGLITLKELVDKADKALYMAKNSGKNQVVI